MLTNKDIRVENGNIVINGDKYPLASQAEIDEVKDDIDNLGDTIGDITQTGVTGSTVAAQLGTLATTVKNIIVDTVTISDKIQSIGANSYTDYTISVAKSGYIPLAVVGVSYTGGVGVDLARFYISEYNAKLLLHNVTSNIYTPEKISVAILYIEV